MSCFDPQFPDVKLTGSITDVRNLNATGSDYDDPDGLPDLTEVMKVRMTDAADLRTIIENEVIGPLEVIAVFYLKLTQ